MNIIKIKGPFERGATKSVDKKHSYSRKRIRGSSLGWKNRKSQLKGIMHPEQSVKLKGFSFMFIFNTRRTQGMFSGEDLNAPGCPRTRSHLQSIMCYLGSVEN